MLLRHLLRELEVVYLWRHIGHLSLHLKVGTRKVLLRLYHAHVNILLVCCSDLLLLLLKDLDLLGNGEMFHYTRHESALPETSEKGAM